MNFKIITSLLVIIVFLTILVGLQKKSPFQLLSPVSSDFVLQNEISALLSEKKNSFTLFKNKSLLPQSYAAGEYEKAVSYLLIDYDTGEILLSKASSEQVPIASLTKIMTAVVALDLASDSELFTVSSYAPTIEPTSIGVKSGQKMTVNELLHGLLMTSANDAAQVLKEGVDKKYGKEVFTSAMNEKAKIIGLSHTQFDNPQGFDSENNYSTAEDLAILSRFALSHYPLIAEISKKDYMFLPKDKNHKQFDLYNWNGLLEVYPNVSGLKIGNTERAQKTTVVVSERKGKKLLAVLLGAPGILERDLWTSMLLDDGFSQTIHLPKVALTEGDLYKKYSSWEYF